MQPPILEFEVRKLETRVFFWLSPMLYQLSHKQIFWGEGGAPPQKVSPSHLEKVARYPEM
jgi:hypothetical protein